jgi:hypothetical protein
MCLEIDWIADSAAIGQLIVAVVAAIFTGISIFTAKKIKELIALTEEQQKQTAELIKQTDILNSRFQLEKALSQRNRIPVLIKLIDEVTTYNPGFVIISFYNEGVTARNFTITEMTGTKFRVEFKNEIAPNNGDIVLLITSNVPEIDDISFRLNFETLQGTKHFQVVRKIKFSAFKIDPPVD